MGLHEKMNNGKKIILESDIFQLSLATEEPGELSLSSLSINNIQRAGKRNKIRKLQGLPVKMVG